MDAAPKGTVASRDISPEELRLAARNHALPLEALRHEITPTELRLAARNHALPLEALRYPVTPAGLHYLLIHYDIPAVDADAWRLEVGGAVERPASLSLADLRALPAVTRRVTMECAGNGRALLAPRPVSQPWLTEAVGTAEWTGTPLAPPLEEAAADPEIAQNAPYTTPVRRLDEAGAAKRPVVRWRPD